MQAALLIWSLGNKPDESELLWNVVAYGLGVFNLGTIGMVLWTTPQFSATVLLSGAGSLLTFLVTSFVQGQVFQIIVTAPFYILMIPLFIVSGCTVDVEYLTTHYILSTAASYSDIQVILLR